MFTKRIIPCLDVNAGRVVKGVNFVDLKDAGDPVAIAKAYDEAGADELVFLDITASSDNRATVADMVSRVQYLKMRIAYEAGRDDNGRVHPVKDFVMAAKLMQYIDEIKSRQDLILYCNYMEALVAYHRFYGGHDK